MPTSPSCAQPRAAREELFVAPDVDAPVRVPLPDAALARIVLVRAAVVRAAVVRAAVVRAAVVRAVALAAGAVPAVLLEALPAGLLAGLLAVLPAGLLAGVLVALPAGLPAGLLAVLLTGLPAGAFVPGALPAEVLDADADAPAFCCLVPEAGAAVTVLGEAGAFADADLGAGTRPALFVSAEPADLLFEDRPEVAAVAAAVFVVEAAALVRARRGAGTVAVGVGATGRATAATSLGNSLAPLTMSLNPCPALNRGTELACTRTLSPVRGLRAARAGRSARSKTPKPLMATFSPAATARVTAATTDSRACVAVLRLPSKQTASSSIRRALFTGTPSRHAEPTLDLNGTVGRDGGTDNDRHPEKGCVARISVL